MSEQQTKPIIQKGIWAHEPTYNSFQPKKWYKADFEGGVETRRWELKEYAGETAPDGTVIIDPNAKKEEVVENEEQTQEDNNQDNANETQVNGSEENPQDQNLGENQEEVLNENSQDPQIMQVNNDPFSQIHNDQGKHNQGGNKKEKRNRKNQ